MHFYTICILFTVTPGASLQCLITMYTVICLEKAKSDIVDLNIWQLQHSQMW